MYFCQLNNQRPTMSKLTEFYAHRAALKEQGLTTDPQWDQLEDQLLKEELLPELIKQLKTTLSKVKSPLMFSGCYDPNGVLSVSITRNCIITNASVQLEANQERISPPTIAQKPDTDGPKRTRGKSIGFSVSFPDGTIICEDKAVDTFIKALQMIGLKRIASDGQCPIHSGYSLVGIRENNIDSSTQHFVDGYFIYTKLSNDTKKADLNTLSDHYGLGMKIRNV